MNTSPATLPPAPARAPRLSAADWAQVALDVIAEQGVAAVAVEPLAAPQSEAVQTSIDAQDRWSGPVSPKEILPHAWEGRLRLRNGKPVFTKA